MKNDVIKAGRSFLITFMAILISMGMAYFFLHLNYIPKFSETNEIFRIQAGGAYDEYTDYLYPVIVGIFVRLGNVTGISLLWLLYFMQAGFLLLAFQKFLGRFSLFQSEYLIQNLAKKLFVSLFLLCNPIMMQLTVSVLPHSFALGSMLLTFHVYLKRQHDLNTFIQGILGIMLTGLLMEEMMWLLLLSLLLHQLYLFLGRIRQPVLTQWFLLILVGVGMGISIFLSLLQEEGSQGKVIESKESKFLQAFVYPDYALYYPHFEEKVRLVLSEKEAKILSEREGNLQYYGSVFFEEEKDASVSKELYASMFQTVFEMNTKNTILKAWDKSMDYLFAPFTIIDNFNGNSKSMTGWNYGRMIELHPVFSAIYMKFGLYIMSLFYILIGIIKIVTAICYRQIRIHKLPLPFFLLLLVNGFYYGIFGITSFDYKNTATLFILSLTYFVVLLFQKEE